MHGLYTDIMSGMRAMQQIADSFHSDGETLAHKYGCKCAGPKEAAL